MAKARVLVSDATKAVPTVLVVDQDPWTLDLVKDALAGEPCRVVTARDPAKALPLLEWERADVLLADMNLPEMDGVDLLVAARKLFPDVPRVVLTATPTIDRILRAVNEAEIHRVLLKPVSPKVLRDTLREALERRFEGRTTETARRQAQERGVKLSQLSQDHPGIGSVEAVAGVYVLTPARLRELEDRFRASPLAPLLASPTAGTAVRG